MGEDAALDSPAAIGPGGGRLEIKLHRRKHLARGSRMARKCIFERYPEGSLGIHAPQLFCRVCSFWGYVRPKARTGGELDPGTAGPSLTDELRRAAGQSGWEKADRLGTHGVRRGGGKGDIRSWAKFRTPSHGRPITIYGISSPLDLGAEEQNTIASNLIEAPDDEGPGRQEPREEGIPCDPRRLGPE